MIKVSQLVVSLDHKPIEKMTKKVEYLYQQLERYNKLVIEVNKNLDKHEILRKKSGVRLPKKDGDKK